MSSSAPSTRALRRIDRSDIAAAPEGERVKIVGTVSAPAPLLSSNRRVPCVHFHARYEERPRARQGRGHGSYGWAATNDELRSCDFLVEDATGTARVDATSIVVILGRASYVAVDVVVDVLRAREAVVAIGQRVAVVGVARYEIDGDGADDYREPKRRLVIAGDEQSPVVVSTDAAVAEA